MVLLNAPALRLTTSALVYGAILLLAGEFQFRPGGAAIVFLIFWTAQLTREIWAFSRSAPARRP